MTASYLSVCIDLALLIHFDFLAPYNVHASADVITAECHMTFVWAERHGQAIAGPGPGDLLLHLRGSGVFEDPRSVPGATQVLIGGHGLLVLTARCVRRRRFSLHCSVLPCDRCGLGAPEQEYIHTTNTE